MKISANFEDKNRIREWAATGLGAQEISERVLVSADYVQKYLDSLEMGQAKPEMEDGEENATIKQHKSKAKRSSAEESD